MEIEITRLSSKGQIVIPLNMRSGTKEGDKFIIFRKGETYILRRATEADKRFAEDVEFAEKTEQALRSHEKGEFKKMSSGDFLKELKKW